MPDTASTSPFADTRDNVEAAKYLGLSPHTLNAYRVSGNGPRYLKIGSRVRYRRVDLDEWLRERIVSNTSEAEARLGSGK